MGKKDIAALKPAAAGAALTLKMETVFIKRLLHKILTPP